MILSFINIRKVPREMLKTSGFALGFQHLPRDLANVNEWKIMFDPYILFLVNDYIFDTGNPLLGLVYIFVVLCNYVNVHWESVVFCENYVTNYNKNPF